MNPSFKNIKIELNPQLFNEAIQKYGVRVIWKRAMMCWCFSSNGQPDPNCTDCHGDGTIYVNPKEIRVLAYSSTGEFENDEIGLRGVGQCTVTVKPEDQIGYRDMLVFPDFLCSYSEFISESQNPACKTKYPVESVVTAKYKDGDLVVDTDFSVDPNKMNIVWDKVTQQPDRFSILYMMKPVYIVMDILKELRGSFIKDGRPTEEFVALPRQFLIKKDDFGRRVEE